ncbi:MAG TPA: DUF4440 domain-containing protein [Kofleriaceae bacterium]|jgi:hypothetical protein
MWRGLPIIVCSLLACGTADVRTTLRAQTQAYLDAIGSGDRPVWDRLLDPAMTFFDENGKVYDKAGILKELDPLPAGITGHLELAKFEVRELGADIAVVFHEDHETESFHGVPVVTDYRTLDTWRRDGQRWRLIASAIQAVLRDPPAITLPPAQLDDYVGTYRLGADLSYAIRRDGAKLFGERVGSNKPVELFVEVRDVLFAAGAPRSRKIFFRDEAGKVTGFGDRREGRDLMWKRE